MSERHETPSLLVPFVSHLRPIAHPSISLRVALLQLLASVAVLAATKLFMLAAVLPEAHGFLRFLTGMEGLLLLRHCLYEGITLVVGLLILFLATMYLLPQNRVPLRRGVAFAWAAVFAALSLYVVVAFLHWRRFYTYPSWVELGMASGSGPLLATLGRLADDRPFAVTFLVFALAHAGALYVGLRSKKPLTRPEVRLWACGVALLAGVAISGWLAPRIPLPRPVVTHPVISLMYQHSRLGATRTMAVKPGGGDATACPVDAGGSTGQRHAGRAAVTAPNVVVIFWESAPARLVHPWSGGGTLTPQLAAMRDRYCAFERVYSNGALSFPARFAFLFSQYCPMAVDNWGIRQVEFSLPRAFRNAGYRTLAVGSNNMVFSGTRQLLIQAGFDHIEDHATGGAGYLPHVWGVDDRMAFDRARSLLEERSDQPAFLFLMTSSSHEPYQAPLPGFPPASSAPRDLHAAALMYDDALIGSFARWLERPGARPTLLLVVGDHGEGFNDHPGHVGHGNSLYEECTHVPCLVFDRHRFSLPASIPTLGSILDLGPTLLELTGHPPRPEHQGRSLLVSRPDDAAISYLPYLDPTFSWRQGRFKLIAGLDLDTNELYDVEADPLERTNLAARHPDVVDCLRRRLAAWLAKQGEAWKRWF